MGFYVFSCSFKAVIGVMISASIRCSPAQVSSIFRKCATTKCSNMLTIPGPYCLSSARPDGIETHVKSHVEATFGRSCMQQRAFSDMCRAAVSTIASVQHRQRTVSGNALPGSDLSAANRPVDQANMQAFKIGGKPLKVGGPATERKSRTRNVTTTMGAISGDHFNLSVCGYSEYYRFLMDTIAWSLFGVFILHAAMALPTVVISNREKIRKYVMLPGE